MLDKIRLTKRVWAVVGVLWGLMALLIWNGYTGLRDARESMLAIEKRLLDVNQLSRVADALLENRLALLLAFQHNPASELAKLHDHPVTTHLEAIASKRADIDKEWSEYVNDIVTPEEQGLAATALDRRKAWRAKLDVIVAALAAGDYGVDKMQLLLLAGRTEGTEAVKAVEALKNYQEERAKEAFKAAEVRYERAMALFAGMLVVAVLSVLFTLTVLSRLNQGFAQANAAAKSIAEGELARPVEVTGEDEVGELLGQMAAMRESLVDIIQQVRTGADHIANASSQVSMGMQDLAQRTERQAGSVQQTAAAVEQLNGTVKQNTESANSADRMAGEATGVAMRGGEAVDAVILTMNEINTSSKKVADIVNVINEIAFQTNILALNAAVEAARAGTHGMGFAVVATEVRSLAQRTGQSAKEIKHLIEESVRKVTEGSEQVGRAGETMREIVNSISSVTGLVNEIATSSREQSAGLSQITDAVTSMETNTSQNAALVEETSAASTALSTQAQQLAAMVSRFHLN